jgi:TPR repeat protein
VTIAVRIFLLVCAPIAVTSVNANDLNDLGKIKLKALNGDPSSQLRLGFHYSTAKENLAEAFFWYEKAAKAGEPSACHYVAKAYATGRGTPQNLELAKVWYEKAALNGNATAMGKLGDLISVDDANNTVNALSHAWYSLAVEHGETAWTERRDLLAKGMSEETLKLARERVEEIKGKILPPKERRPTPPSPTKKRGEYHFQNGQKYFGDLKDGIPHGYGRIKSPNGERFFGEFQNGKPFGYGTHFSSQGFIIFSGLWEGDKAIAGDSPQARLRAMLKSP